MARIQASREKVRALAEESAMEARSGSGDWRRTFCRPCELRTGKPDRRGSFSFNQRTGFYHCFKCGLVGRVDGEFEEVDRTGVAANLNLPMMPEEFIELGRGDGARAVCTAPAREYLKNRGLADVDLWRKAQLGACIAGFFRDRVVIPILSPENQWRGFVARTWLKDDSLKYRYPKGMNRAELIYNHAALLEDTDFPVFVVEGVLDALALWPDSVALLGTASEEQVLALAESRRPVAIALDGDAWVEGEALALRLKLEGQRAGSIRLPPKLDPDEVPREWLEEEAERCLS